MERLERSLDELRIAHADAAGRARVVHARSAGATACATASSICRSPAAWRAATMRFRRPAPRPSIVVTARNLDLAGNERIAAEGIAVITVPDNRWARVDIKSVSLLPNVLAKQAAREQGAREAWFVDATAASPKAHRPMPGSSPRRQGGDPAGRHGILRGITRTRADRRHRGAGAGVRGARRSRSEEAYARARGLHDLGQPDRHAGGAHRRAPGRQWGAGTGRHRAAARNSTATPNGT